MTFEIEPAGLHEAERLGDAVCQFLVVMALRRVLHEAERPLPDIGEVRVAAVHERAEKVERRGGMPVGLDQPQRIGAARLFGEGDVVDDVAPIARQFLAVLLLRRRGARLGELAGDAADLHHRQRRRVGEHDRHLQEDAQEVANVVGADIIGARLGEALRAVAALQQETLAHGDLAERLLEIAGFTCKYERREVRDLLLDSRERGQVWIIGNLQNVLPAPAIARPTLGHDKPLHSLSPSSGDQISTAYTRLRAPEASRK